MKNRIYTTLASLLLVTIPSGLVLADDWNDKSAQGSGRSVAPFAGGGGNWRYDDDWSGGYYGNSGGNYGTAPNWYYQQSGYVVPGQASGYFPVPAEYQLLELDERSLLATVRDSTTQFDRWLSEIPAGEVWRKHFETRTVLNLVTPEPKAPLAADQRQEIVRVVAIYDRAVENPDLSTLTRTDQFRAAHAALRELAIPRKERLVRQLSLSARALHHSLGQFNTGSTWQRYLGLPDSILAAADRPAGAERSGKSEKVDAEELAPILDHYDRVTENPEYRRIAALAAFQVTHERLTALVNPQTEPSARVEALPSPQANAVPPPPPPGDDGTE